VRSLRTAVVVVSALLSGYASAADLPVRYQKAPVADTIFSWTGFYGGAEGIYGFGSGRTADAGPTDVTTKSSGGAFGAYGGFNYEFSNHIVAGVEANLDYADISGSSIDSVGIQYTNRFTWLGSARARLGYSFGQVLLFGTAGVAFSGVDHTVNDTPGATTGLISFHDTYAGWTAGGGADYAITPSLIARLEYRYYEFTNTTYGNTTAGGGAYFWTPHEFQPKLQTVSAGLAVKF
jgi:outer membrane immunogenic protein